MIKEGWVSRDTLDRIRQIPLEEIISRHVQLRQDGRSLRGLCPFHKEKTPSFKVNTERNFFKCFGCGKGGDALTFVMAIDNINFYEAVERLAREHNIPFRDDPISRAERQATEELYAVFDEASKYYERELFSHMDVVDYLQTQRGLKHETIRKWRIGFSYGGVDRILFEKFDEQTINRSGLVRTDGFQKRHDFFRGRITIPIMDANGRVIAFAGRAFNETPGTVPKFINSPENPLYKKSKVLFGLDKAHQEIRDVERAVIVEGYFDVIALHQAGLDHVVASAGTSLTREQLKSIEHLVNELTLCYDGDERGKEAALKAGAQIVSAGIPVRVMSINGDPDDYVRSNGQDMFRETDCESGDLLSFAMGVYRLRSSDDTHPLDAADESYIKVQELYAIVDAAHEPLRKSLWLKDISNRLGIDFDIVCKDYSEYQSRNSRKQQPPDQCEERFLGMLAANPLQRRSAESTFTEWDFSRPEYGMFFRFITTDPTIHDSATPNVDITLDNEADQMLLFNGAKRNDIMERFSKFCEDDGEKLNPDQLARIGLVLLHNANNSAYHFRRMELAVYERRLESLERELRKPQNRFKQLEALKEYSTLYRKYESLFQT